MFQGGFNQSYDQYLILRGHDPSSSKLIILKRALINSWAETGFHQFWRVLNSGIGYLLFRLYLAWGGNRNRLIATMLVFAICGFLHNVFVMLISTRPFIAFTAALLFLEPDYAGSFSQISAASGFSCLGNSVIASYWQVARHTPHPERFPAANRW